MITSEPGCSLCWDNVQKLSNKGDGTDNKMMSWALSFATGSRIGFLNLDDFDETVPAMNIPLHVIYLKQYIPLDPNAMPILIVCNGDKLSGERMVTGRLAMAVSEEAEDQLVGLIPRPQGFHKRCILLQVEPYKIVFLGSQAT